MPAQITVEQIMPLVEALAPEERARLVRLITASHGSDSSTYAARPPANTEFSTDEDLLAWDGEGWESVA